MPASDDLGRIGDGPDDLRSRTEFTAIQAELALSIVAPTMDRPIFGDQTGVSSAGCDDRRSDLCVEVDRR